MTIPVRTPTSFKVFRKDATESLQVKAVLVLTETNWVSFYFADDALAMMFNRDDITAVVPVY